MIPLASVALGAPGVGDCWNRIGIHGERSCPELSRVVHCQNCPVFSAAGRKFLNAPSPEGYQDEWTQRLADLPEERTVAQDSVLIFRLGEEWLAFSVSSLVEIAPMRTVRRIPHRGGVIAGLVNIRGELLLCAHLGTILGIEHRFSATTRSRMMVVRCDQERWVFTVDEVDQVHRIPSSSLGRPPATVGRAASMLSLGVFPWEGRTVGLLDSTRLFEALRAKLR